MYPEYWSGMFEESDLTPEDQIEHYDNVRDWFFSAAGDFYYSPSPGSYAKLEAIRPILGNEFAHVMNVFVETSDSSEELAKLTSEFYSDEDHLRVRAINSIVGWELCGFITGEATSSPKLAEYLSEIDWSEFPTVITNVYYTDVAIDLSKLVEMSGLFPGWSA